MRVKGVLLFFALLSISGCALLPVSSCKECEVDHLFVGKIWERVVSVTNIAATTPSPQIKFLQRVRHKAHSASRLIYGMFFQEGQEVGIEIYSGSVCQYFKNRRHYTYMGDKEARALFYNTIAHEMLHYALYVQGLPVEMQHRPMKDGGYLERMVDFISNYFQIPTDGPHKSVTMERLDCRITEEINSPQTF